MWHHSDVHHHPSKCRRITYSCSIEVSNLYIIPKYYTCHRWASGLPHRLIGFADIGVMYCHIFAARTKRFSFGNFCCFNFSSMLTSMNLTSWQASTFIEETNYLINSFVSFHGFASACTRQQSESMHVCLHEVKNLTPTPVIDSSETISPGRPVGGHPIDVFFHTHNIHIFNILQKNLHFSKILLIFASWIDENDWCRLYLQQNPTKHIQNVS